MTLKYYMYRIFEFLGVRPFGVESSWHKCSPRVQADILVYDHI